MPSFGLGLLRASSGQPPQPFPHCSPGTARRGEARKRPGVDDIISKQSPPTSSLLSQSLAQSQLSQQRSGQRGLRLWS